jgi:hypothetical protein
MKNAMPVCQGINTTLNEVQEHNFCVFLEEKYVHYLQRLSRKGISKKNPYHTISFFQLNLMAGYCQRAITHL